MPHWYKHETDGPLIINARAETIAEKPAFRSSCRERRCIIPATGFFEWRSDAPKAPKIPFYIHPREDGALLAFAGVWRSWGDPEGEAISTCAIVTCAANDSLTPLHHRMPVILAEADWALWLGEKGKGAAALMRPADDELLVYHEVTRAVSSARSEGPHLIEPVDPERTLL